MRTVSAQELSAAVIEGGQTYPVGTVDFDFRPSRVTINVGDTVEWKNYGPSAHTTTGENARDWDSGPLGPGGTFSRTFETKGTFRYLCTIHPWMRGVVTVVDSGAPAPSQQTADIRSTTPAANYGELAAAPPGLYGGLHLYPYASSYYPSYSGYRYGYPHYRYGYSHFRRFGSRFRGIY